MDDPTAVELAPTEALIGELLRRSTYGAICLARIENDGSTVIWRRFTGGYHAVAGLLTDMQSEVIETLKESEEEPGEADEDIEENLI